jgi:hypothetical protein
VSNKFRTPNHNEILFGLKSDGTKADYVTVTNNKLDVNATVTSTSSDGAILDGVSSAIKATVLDLTSSNPLTVAITDATGAQVTSFGGGTQYTDGGTPPAHPVGGTIEWSDGANWQTASSSKPLPVSIGSTGTVAVTGVATSTKQSDGSQKTQVVDGSGNVIGATSNALDVNIKSGGFGGNVTLQSGTAYAGRVRLTDGTNDTTLRSLTGTKALDVSIVDGSGNQITAFGGGTQYTDGGTPPTHPVGYATIFDNSGAWLNVSATNRYPVSAAQNGNWSVRTQDGSGNTIGSTSNALDVNIKSGGFNGVVTNGGTFATQSTLQAGSNQIGHLEANQSVNHAQVAGTATSVNNGTVDAGTQRVTIASNSTGQVALAAGTALVGKVSSGADTTNIYDGTTALTPKFAVITASASGNTQIVAAVTSKKIRVLSWSLMSAGTTNVKWQSATTDKTGLYYLIANTGIAEAYCPVGLFETAAGEALNINLSVAVATGGRLTYVEV